MNIRTRMIAGQTSSSSHSTRRLFASVKSLGALMGASKAKNLKARAEVHFKYLEKDNFWSAAQLRQNLDEQFQNDQHVTVTAHLGLFSPQDVVWIGEKSSGGSTDTEHNFEKSTDWSLQPKWEPFTSGSVYKPGSERRCLQNVLSKRFLVIEPEFSNEDKATSLFNWLKRFLRLRAIVDSAGDGLHAWFDYPHLNDVEALGIILSAFQCSSNLDDPIRPCRLAGAWRPDKRLCQHLVYIDQS